MGIRLAFLLEQPEEDSVEQKDSRPRPRNLIQAIERMSRILSRVGQNPHGISVKDLSKELKLPKPTIHRFLSSLSYFGYIRQNPEKRNYFLGFKFMELNSLLHNQIDLRELAEPILRDLAERANETVHMVVLDANEVVYIDKVEKKITQGLAMSSMLGSRNPVHCCAVGKVLAAHMSEKEVDCLIEEKGLSRRTPHTITDPASFKKHLKTVKDQGFAIDDEENEPGIRCVAAPIFGQKEKPVAAISVSGPAFRITKTIARKILKQDVVEAALQISRQLGYQTRVHH
jgi:DNA-binding IclR family transcriptional regulator